MAGVLVVVLGGVAGTALVLWAGGKALGGVFGTCEHTPAVVASVADDLERRGYRVVQVEYDCARGAAAEVLADRATLWVAPEGAAVSPDDLTASVVGDLTGAGWSSTPEPDRVRSRGYSTTAAVHSTSPPLAVLTVRRDDVDADTGWDRERGGRPATPAAAADVRRYALLPDLTPSWSPDGFAPWATRYTWDTEYRATAQDDEAGVGLSLRVVAAGADGDGDPCADPDICLPVGTTDDGVAVQEVVRVPRPGATVRDGRHVAVVGDAHVYLTTWRITRDHSDAPQPRLQDVLTREEILRVYGSVNTSAQAPAR